MALRWKKDPAPTGLARVTAGPRGSSLRIDGGMRVATVRCRWSLLNPVKEWFWVAGWEHPDIPHRNTCNEPSPTEADAKAEALAYVRKYLNLPTKGRD